MFVSVLQQNSSTHSLLWHFISLGVGPIYVSNRPILWALPTEWRADERNPPCSVWGHKLSLCGGAGSPSLTASPKPESAPTKSRSSMCWARNRGGKKTRSQTKIVPIPREFCGFLLANKGNGKTMSCGKKSLNGLDQCGPTQQFFGCFVFKGEHSGI